MTDVNINECNFTINPPEINEKVVEIVRGITSAIQANARAAEAAAQAVKKNGEALEKICSQTLIGHQFESMLKVGAE